MRVHIVNCFIKLVLSACSDGSQPIFTAVATFFVDFGNVYEKLEDIDVTDVHYTLGTGVRWKVESFVKTELFLDYGYNPEEQDGKLYGGTSLNF